MQVGLTVRLKKSYEKGFLIWLSVYSNAKPLMFLMSKLEYINVGTYFCAI